LLHPDIQLGLAWGESHVPEAIGKAFMPAKARGPDAIKCLEDDEGVAFQLTKFRTCNDENLFLHFGFKISIANVDGPNIQVIELGQEYKELGFMKGDNTRVDTIEWDFCEVPISNESTLVASIMFHVKDKVDTNLPVTIRGLSSFAQVLEGLVLMELGHLKGSRILLLGIPIVLVKLNGMVIVSWDFIAILVAWHCVVQPELGLVGHAKELLVVSGYPLKVFPSIEIK